MRKFKDFLLENLLVEYLTDEQRNRYKDVVMSPAARKATDHFFGEGNDHVREDVIGHEPDKSEVHRAVERHLGKQIDHQDYVKGLTKDQHGRDVRLGRLIRDEKLRNQFANDNTRAGAKKSSGHYMTIVRGTEVAGQTNSAPNQEHPKGHSWGNMSCKNVDDGINRHYLEQEIYHGTVVVRAHDHTGQEIYRATLQPHHNELGEHAYAVDSEYGLIHPSFTTHAHDVAQRLSGTPNVNRPGYTKHVSVYNDNNIRYILHPNLTAKHLDQVYNNPDRELRDYIPHHPNVTNEQLHALASDRSTGTRWETAQSRMAKPEHLEKLLNDQSADVIKAAAANPNLPDHKLTELLSKKLDSSGVDITYDKAAAEGAAKNPSLKQHHFDIIKNHPDYSHQRVKVNAAMNPKASEDYLLHAVSNPHNTTVAIQAAYNPNASRKVLMKALDHDHISVRSSAIENPRADHHVLHKALDDYHANVRIQALSHPNIDDSHLEKAMHDKDNDVAMTAVYHKKASRQLLNKITKTARPEIVGAANDRLSTMPLTFN